MTMILRRTIAALGLLAAAPLLSPMATAEPIATNAKHLYIVDFQTGSVLYDKMGEERLAPASMSKLMTVYMLFDALKRGDVKLTDTFHVSKKAWAMQGSKMFVDIDSDVKVEDLLRGILIQSGNDACIVVAEALGGSEEAFADMMTARAREIGLTHSTFKNASGWPDPDHLMSVRDLAMLAQIMIEQFPEYYPIFSQTEYTYNGIRQHSRNPLLNHDLGVDGLKTGHTDTAGYGLTASAMRDGRRVVFVLAGLERPGERAREAERLLEYGYREFKDYKLFSAGDTVEQAHVWLGDHSSVPLVLQQDVVVSLTTEGRRGLDVRVAYDGPIPAPVAMGDQIAQLQVAAPGIDPRQLPLIAGATVHAANLFGRVTSALGYLIWGPS